MTTKSSAIGTKQHNTHLLLVPLALQKKKERKNLVVLPQSKHSESASELPASPPHELESGIFFMEQSKMEIHNDFQANPHPPYLILLQLSKKSPVY